MADLRRFEHKSKELLNGLLYHGYVFPERLPFTDGMQLANVHENNDLDFLRVALYVESLETSPLRIDVERSGVFVSLDPSSVNLVVEEVQWTIATIESEVSDRDRA